MMKKSLLAILCGVLGGVFTLILVTVVHLENRPDLKLWHQVHLDAEFTHESPVSDMAAYRALEERLFGQLKRQVLDRLPVADRKAINRYHRGSLTDPGRWQRNWNRTFELEAQDPAAGVLLLHGMSDAPYSLRAIGTELNDKGAWVLGLRLPGHGTVPSGLVRLEWEDAAAAVRLGMRHLNGRLGDKPLFIIGYSMGGALAVAYALEQLANDDLPPVAKIVLISPAIGVTRLAALSVWQARLGRWLWLDKLAWNSIVPEYNSYKYSSFAINAGHQIHRLTRTIQKRLGSARQSGTLNRFPPVLTFQSAVDATVSTTAVFSGLYHRLTNAGNELVVFDINRRAGVSGLMDVDPLDRVLALHAAGNTDYRFRLVTNESVLSRQVNVVTWEDGGTTTRSAPLDWSWPDRVHSLSHIALPFPVDDPLYGTIHNDVNPGIVLSTIFLQGEKGVIDIPANDVLRLRWNPFYPYLSRRTAQFLGF